MIARPPVIMSERKSDGGGADAFSAIEEEFFRAGDAMNAASSVDAGADREVAPAASGGWSRLFKRTPRPVQP